MAARSFHSPLGPITVVEQDGVIVSLGWGWHKEADRTGLLRLARDQIAEYFDGERKSFALPLAPSGTPFQRAVWRHMLRIPYGETRCYGDMARDLDSGPRAVGTACARNPIPILIPCHRVVGRNGDLTGYSGGDGLASKDYLLRLETGRAV